MFQPNDTKKRDNTEFRFRKCLVIELSKFWSFYFVLCRCVGDRSKKLLKMTETLKLRGTLCGHNGWVTQIATNPKYPDMILSSSRGKRGYYYVQAVLEIHLHPRNFTINTSNNTLKLNFIITGAMTLPYFLFKMMIQIFATRYLSGKRIWGW